MNNESLFDNPILEAIFRQAVIDDLDYEIQEALNSQNMDISERQAKRMETLFKSERIKEVKRQRFERSLRFPLWPKRLAYIIVVLILVIGFSFVTVPEVRASVKNALIQWFDEFVKFDDNSGESTIEAWRPSYVPDGFVTIQSSMLTNTTTIIYGNNNGEYIEFQGFPSNSSVSFNYENIEYSQYVSDGITYHTFSSTSTDFKSSVVWDYGEYRFFVSGNVTIELLLDIAKSVAIW
jgi:hypothetical protein